MRKNLFFMLLVCIAWAGIAQQTHNFESPILDKPIRCGSNEYEQMLRTQFPGTESREDFELWLEKEIKKQAIAGKTRSIIYIPTIVHVIHNGESVGVGSNISQAQVNSQFTVLNQDFSRSNPDTVNTPSVFASVAADIEIQFCPALVDTNGLVLAEPGIDRIDRNAKGWLSPPYNMTYIDSDIKPNSGWNPDNYFNIWVLDLGNALTGYSQFPNSSGLSGIGGNSGPAATDGVVILYQTFGTVGNLLPPYNLGRITVHEVGHWLGLIHIWGDDGGSCSGSDFCGDTPNQGGENYGCPTFPNVSCSNGPNGDMFMNYMDYSNDICMNMFTLNQKARMQTVMAVSPRRASLASSSACSLLSQPPVANFSVSDSVICNGSSVQFTFSGTASANATYSWTFGTTGITSLLQNPNITFPSQGVYQVQLIVSDAFGSDTLIAHPITVTNTCSIEGNIVANPANVDTFTVYLIQYDSVAGTLTAIDTIQNVSNHYHFLNVVGGSYLIKAATNQGSPSYNDYLPTYYGSSLIWSSASYINVPSPTQSYDIQLIAGSNPGGPGFIGGLVSQGANKPSGVGDPLADIEVILFDLNDTPITYTYTDVNGVFAFSNLAYGTYKVWAEFWGKETTPEIVTISATQPSINSISIAVNTTYITSSITESQLINGWEVYPNPTKDEIHISMHTTQPINCTLEIIDVCGKSLYSEATSLGLGAQKKDISVKNLPNGIYYLKMSEEGLLLKVCKLIKL